MGSILNISVSGMNAAQVGLQTVQHNVANANTDGYSRQKITQATRIPNATGAGYIGTGTQVSSVNRLYDSFLSGQVNKAQTTLSALQASASQMESIDQLLADPTAGVAPAIEDFFSAAQEVGAYPSSVAARQTLVSSSQVLVNRFAVMGETINSLNDQINTQITTDVDALNGLASQLAAVNGEIANAAGTGYQPNDLLDRRDLLISEIGKIVDVSVTTVTTDGGVSADYAPVQIYMGNGHVLVSEASANKVSVVRSSEDPAQLTFSLGGKEVHAGDVTGGSLGGLLTFRDGTLATAQNSLGQVAFALASSFNEQHMTGMDLMGGQGQAFFNFASQVDTVGSPATAPALTITLETPELTGDTITDYYKTTATNSDYTLTYDGSNYTLTRESDGINWQGATLTAVNDALDLDTSKNGGPQGFKLNDKGSVIAAGTSYKIRPMADIATGIGINSAIVSDVRLVAAGLSVKASTTASNNAKTGNANTGSMDGTVVRLATNSQTLVGGGGLTLSYETASNELTGFGGATVKVTGTDGKSYGSSPYTGGSVPYVPGATYNADGVVFTLSGKPDDGDTLSLVLNNQSPIGVSDSSNLLLLSKLETAKVINGAATYGGSYAQLVSNIGNRAASTKQALTSQQSLYDLSLARKESNSGVNLDEEAANLIYYQQAYQANAKSLQAAQKLFDTLMSIMN